jgi:hypothetical protein
VIKRGSGQSPFPFFITAQKKMALFYPSDAFIGRNGGYVGENNNGTAYCRHYVDPYDPKTPAQR